jgi:Domain of unknown function (DUF4372)
MYQGKLVFAQVMAHLPLTTFRCCVALYNGDFKVQDFSCLDQFLAMAFAQFTYRESLRDIQINLRAQASRLYHLGFRCKTISRNTLANANATPRYNPWKQRLCLVPDSDLFNALKSQKASIVTGQIDGFTEAGIKLNSGEELAAALIVTATGLQLEMLGGLDVSVDGKQIEFSKTMVYKGMMYSEVPNMASVFGYTNASWTLKADLTSQYVCRLLKHIDKTDARYCVPRLHASEVTPLPWVEFSSGYFQRAKDILPKQGATHPWKLYQNYVFDIVTLRFGSVQDSAMEFCI